MPAGSLYDGKHLKVPRNDSRRLCPSTDLPRQPLLPNTLLPTPLLPTPLLPNPCSHKPGPSWRIRKDSSLDATLLASISNPALLSSALAKLSATLPRLLPGIGETPDGCG